MTDTLVQSVDVRQRFTVTGVVQGVGFRPFVHRIASELGLAGFVGNDSRAVFLEVQGSCARLEEFSRRLRAEAPPLAAINSVHVVAVSADNKCDSTFRIVNSQTVVGATTPIPPDIAVCDDCIAELFDPEQPPSPAPLRDVHQLRSPFHDHPWPALRPSSHHHVGVHHV
jgi:hydrogenase maturation protein HypF